ncbi:hypothetical protein NQ534_05675 [Marvinbryantia formatexigens DSM 14469]|nr:hypothetical protein [Marvinbryantia formatexigens]UWO25959.1 hypothetical protein NQ534_05675 [Marvinbryantia formatexigens DSM 14469]
MIFTMMGVLVNFAFAFMNGSTGWVSRSPWFGTLAAYYLLLGIMKVYWLTKNFMKIAPEKSRRLQKISEKKLRKIYGVQFIFLSIILGGAVILLVNLEGGKEYPGYMIYVAAGYSFIKIVLAISNMIRERKQEVRTWLIIRDIGLVDALMSILTLQTAMFAAFAVDDRNFPVKMNGVTGAVVSLIILGIGISYLVNTRKGGDKS